MHLTCSFIRAPVSARRCVGPEWGTEVNEPGGRLFGEAIRAPGERRVWFDWELPYYATLATATIMCVVGLNSRPATSATVWAREEAIAREEARLAAEEEE